MFERKGRVSISQTNVVATEIRGEEGQECLWRSNIRQAQPRQAQAAKHTQHTQVLILCQKCLICVCITVQTYTNQAAATWLTLVDGFFAHIRYVGCALETHTQTTRDR